MIRKLPIILFYGALCIIFYYFVRGKLVNAEPVTIPNTEIKHIKSSTNNVNYKLPTRL